jgi:UPF0271 protein
MVASRGRLLAAGVPLPAYGGGEVTVEVDSICLHGDTPGAGQLARRLREALQADGLEVVAFAS